LIGVNANNIKELNNFIWGLFDYGNNIFNSLEDLEEHISNLKA